MLTDLGSLIGRYEGNDMSKRGEWEKGLSQLSNGCRRIVTNKDKEYVVHIGDGLFGRLGLNEAL